MVDKRKPSKGVSRLATARQERDRAVKLYTETRLPVGEIATHMGVSRQTVHRWLRAAGIELRGPMGPRDRYVELDEATSDDGAASALMREMGLLHGEIAEVRRLLSDAMLVQSEAAKAHAEMAGVLGHHMAIVERALTALQEQKKKD